MKSEISNRCGVMISQNVMKNETRQIPQIANDEVLVKLEYCGICGSDVHLFMTGKQGDNIAEQPMILGHEASGVISKVGNAVEGFCVGDKVAIEPGRVCHICEYCKQGKYNLCKSMVFPSTPPVDGMFSQYVKVPYHTVFKLPYGISTQTGSLLEPLACALNATKQGGVELGKTVVIIGDGCIGLLCLIASIARGATTVIVAGRHDNRLELADKKGASYVINTKKEDVEKQVLSYTNGKGADIVIDCSGSSEGLGCTIDLVDNGGVVVLMGMPHQDFIEMNFTKMIWKEITFKSSFRYRNRYPVAIKAIESGHIDLDGIITHEFELDDLQKAFDYVIRNKNDVIKAVVKI